jgi:uncharacterized protein
MVARVSQRTFIDTHFVVALINHTDQHHQIAAEISTSFVGQPLLTTNAVLIEIGDALARAFKIQAIEVLDYFRRAENIETVELTSSLFDDALALFRSHADKSWGLTDCISFVVMRQQGITDVLTHDRHFQQAGFNALLIPG